jgi:predicted nucleic acid-binding Zn ribbon protein
MKHAGTTLRKIFSDTIRHQPEEAALLAWPLACGTKTAERTKAVAFANGVLTVSVPDETWRYQLQSLSPQYLAALNQITARPVSKIIFVPVNKLEHR